MNGSTDQYCRANFINHRSLRAVTKIKNQLKRIFFKNGLVERNTKDTDKNYITNIKKCILSGFFMQIARFIRQNFYMTVKDS